MNRENCNSDMHILVFLRPADALCSALSSFLRQKSCAFSLCSSIYAVFDEIEKVSACQMVLILRPAMLPTEAAMLLQQRYPTLQVVGWVDPDERLSDRAFQQENTGGMMMVGHLDQLLQTIKTLGKTRMRQPAASPVTMTDIEPVEYELSDEEINALLGVE